MKTGYENNNKKTSKLSILKNIYADDKAVKITIHVIFLVISFIIAINSIIYIKHTVNSAKKLKGMNSYIEQNNIEKTETADTKQDKSQTLSQENISEYLDTVLDSAGIIAAEQTQIQYESKSFVEDSNGDLVSPLYDSLSGYIKNKNLANIWVNLDVPYKIEYSVSDLSISSSTTTVTFIILSSGSETNETDVVESNETDDVESDVIESNDLDSEQIDSLDSNDSSNSNAIEENQPLALISAEFDSNGVMSNADISMTQLGKQHQNQL